MIDYHTYCRLHDLHQQQGLNLTQIAQALQLSRDTVSKWLHTERYRARITPARPSKLDPYKAQIRAWLDAHPLSGQQVFQRLLELGYSGGVSIVRDYVRQVRPRRPPAYLTVVSRIISPAVS